MPCHWFLVYYRPGPFIISTIPTCLVLHYGLHATKQCIFFSCMFTPSHFFVCSTAGVFKYMWCIHSHQIPSAANRSHISSARKCCPGVPSGTSATTGSKSLGRSQASSRTHPIDDCLPSFFSNLIIILWSMMQHCTQCTAYIMLSCNWMHIRSSQRD